MGRETGPTVYSPHPRRLEILSNHYVHTGYHEMHTQCRDSVHVLAVTRAAVWKVALDGRYQDQGRGKK